MNWKANVRFIHFVIPVLGMLAAVFTFFAVRDMSVILKEPTDITDADWRKLEPGEKVSLTFDLCFGCMYTENEWEYIFIVPVQEVEVGRGYLVPSVKVNSEGEYFYDHFVSVELETEEEHRLMEQIIANTTPWDTECINAGEAEHISFTVEGVVENASDDEGAIIGNYILSKFNDPLICSGLFRNYVIAPVDTASAYKSLVTAMVVDIIFMVVLVVTLIRHKREENKIAGHVYKGVSETGSTDIYGGIHYGGQNFEGMDYKKPDKSTDENSGKAQEKYEGPWQPYQ